MNDAFITFIYADDLHRSDSFYREMIGLALVTEQPTCRIYQVAESGFLGICVRENRSVTTDNIIITIVRDDVDQFCSQLLAKGVTLTQPPTHNDRFGIYHAFLRDPDGYLIEVQRFDDPAWAQIPDDPGR